MKVVLQRVTSASVTVEGTVTGQIADGFLVLLGVQEGDTTWDADVLAAKTAGLRVFSDSNGKMNLSLSDINGGVLVISNFTLCADCRKGRRPNFINAAKPHTANTLYEYFCSQLEKNGVCTVEKGVFGGDMKVSLLNDGPVTIMIDSKDLAQKK